MEGFDEISGHLVFILQNATDALETRVFAELDGEALHEHAYPDNGTLLIGIELRRRLDHAAVDRLRGIVPTAARRSAELRSVYRGEGSDGPREARRRFEALWVGLAPEGD